MYDPDTFEARFTTAVRRYSADDPRHVDASALARTIAAADARTARPAGLLARLGLRPIPTAPRVLLAAGLIALLAAGTAIVGSQVLRPSPTPLIPADRGVFTLTGSMQETRESPTATLLQDGRVLVVGGYGSAGLAEVWDPRTGTFSPAGTLPHGRDGHTATLLSDGRVLVVGGSSTDGDGAVNAGTSAVIWDPTTVSFTATGSLAAGRWRASATLLPDGRVLVKGGVDASAEAPVVSAEVWDARSGTFAPADAIPEAGHPVGTTLADGRILVFFGANAYIWDPVTRSSTPAGSRTPDYLHSSTVTRLQDGRVLVAGGGGCQPVRQSGGLSSCAVESDGSAEIWDPAMMSFRPTGPMAHARMRHTAVLLDDGRVLLVGDWASGQGTSAEVFELK